MQVAPTQVKNARQVPEYEIRPDELDFSNGIELSKVLLHTFTLAALYNFTYISYILSWLFVHELHIIICLVIYWK